MGKRKVIATVEIVADGGGDAATTQRLRLAALEPDFREWLLELAEHVHPPGLAPCGNRVFNKADLARYLGQTPVYWEKHLWRLIKAGLVWKAQRRWVGDLRKIQQALANPELWADNN